MDNVETVENILKGYCYKYKTLNRSNGHIHIWTDLGNLVEYWVNSGMTLVKNKNKIVLKKKIDIEELIMGYLVTYPYKTYCEIDKIKEEGGFEKSKRN